MLITTPWNGNETHDKSLKGYYKLPCKDILVWQIHHQMWLSKQYWSDKYMVQKFVKNTCQFVFRIYYLERICMHMSLLISSIIFQSNVLFCTKLINDLGFFFKENLNIHTVYAMKISQLVFDLHRLSINPINKIVLFRKDLTLNWLAYVNSLAMSNFVAERVT